MITGHTYLLSVYLMDVPVNLWLGRKGSQYLFWSLDGYWNILFVVLEGGTTEEVSDQLLRGLRPISRGRKREMATRCQSQLNSIYSQMIPPKQDEKWRVIVCFQDNLIDYLTIILYETTYSCIGFLHATLYIYIYTRIYV